MNEASRIQSEDVLPVRSRVSWGAIFAGAVTALAIYFLLTLLGGALGLSIGDNVSARNLGTGATIWAICSMLVALFVGGMVTSQCTAGENKVEAVLYGVLVWALVFALLVLMAVGVLRAGFSAIIGVANIGQSAVAGTTPADWEAAARRAGVPQARIEEWRRQAAAAPEEARQAAADPENRQAVSEGATRAAWYAFAGTLLSILAAVGGTLVGAGPTLQLVLARMRHATVTHRELVAHR